MISAETNPEVKKDDFNSAIEHLNQSCAILPLNEDAYLIKGYAFEFSGNHPDSAIASYRTTLLLDSANKQAANNLGGMLLRKNDLTEAIQILSKVVAKDTGYIDALCNLAAAYGNSGQFKEAEKYYLMALRKNPDEPPNVFMSMSNIYKFMGDSANAQHYRQLLNNALKAAK